MSVAYFFGHLFLPFTLILVMLGMGLSLTFDNFREIFRYPRSLLFGLVCQLLLLPSIAFVIAFLSPISPALKVGLVLMAACPGGVSSGLVTHLFKGNVALSIALTTCNSLASLFTIPVTVNLALWLFIGQTHTIHLPVSATALEIFVLTIIPASIGIAIRHRLSALAIRLDRPLRYMMPLLLGTAFMGVAFTGENSQEHSLVAMLAVLPHALLLNALGICLTFALVRLCGFDRSVQITLPIEAGLHNSSLALYIATVVLSNQDMALVGVAYGSTTFFTTVFWVWLIISRKVKN